MLEIQKIAVSSGPQHVCFGLDNGELSSFGIQMWITKYGKQAVDWVQHLSLGWVSFINGDIWVQNQPETLVDRVNFFGEKKDFIVGAVVNENPSTVKILDSIGIRTDGNWEVLSVTIPKSLSYPNGMTSKIPSGKFKKREGFLRSEFLRNMKTSSGTESVLELMKGEPLRGECAYLVLKNTSTTEVKLYMIELNMTSSKI